MSWLWISGLLALGFAVGFVVRNEMLVRKRMGLIDLTPRSELHPRADAWDWPMPVVREERACLPHVAIVVRDEHGVFPFHSERSA